MADIGLSCADRTEADVLCLATKCLRQSGDFDRITQRGSSPMGLDI